MWETNEGKELHIKFRSLWKREQPNGITRVRWPRRFLIPAYESVKKSEGRYVWRTRIVRPFAGNANWHWGHEHKRFKKAEMIKNTRSGKRIQASIQEKNKMRRRVEVILLATYPNWLLAQTTGVTWECLQIPEISKEMRTWWWNKMHKKITITKWPTHDVPLNLTLFSRALHWIENGEVGGKWQSVGRHVEGQNDGDAKERNKVDAGKDNEGDDGLENNNPCVEFGGWDRDEIHVR